MKNKYEYVISFSFEGGEGSFFITINNKITSFNHLNLIKEHIEQTGGLVNVAIKNYVLVSKREFKRKFIK